jgi:fermentation-respiration switch protein FrsA (DUF1100 family)
MSFFKKGYEDLWKAIIRPPRDQYFISDLGPAKFEIDHRIFQRTDLQLQNPRGLTLECSFFEPIPEERVAVELPCVIYLHGNCSSRVEATSVVPLLLPTNICVFSFDFSGSGLSQGEYISLGYYEKDDVSTVVDFLRTSGKTSFIGLWGRSMGAVTALLHGHRDNSIAGIVLDSPFSSLKKLAKELANRYAKLPGFVLSGAISLVRKTIKKKAKFDINELNPLDCVDKCFIPAMFAAGNHDTFILPHHSEELYQKYSGEKSIKYFECDHNEPRPDFYMHSVAIFFYNVLYCEILPQLPPSDAFSGIESFAPSQHLFQQALIFQEQLLNPDISQAKISEEND